MADSYQDAFFRSQEYKDSLEDTTEATEDTADETKRLIWRNNDAERSYIRLARETDEARRSQAELANELKRMADPVFAAVDSFGDYQDILKEVDRDGKRTAKEQLELAEAILSLQGDLSTLAADGNLTDGIRAISRALGISVEETQALLRELGILDGREVTTIIDVELRVPTTITINGQEEVGIVSTSESGSRLIAFERGGFTGALGGLVHGNEVVLSNPSNSTAVYKPFAAALLDELDNLARRPTTDFATGYYNLEIPIEIDGREIVRATEQILVDRIRDKAAIRTHA